MSEVRHHEVGAHEADWRFDRWCKEHLPGLAFGQMQRLMRTGQFRIDGKRAGAGDRLSPGQLIRIPPLPEAPSQAPSGAPAIRDDAFIRSLVIHEDERLIAFDKPAGLAVQGGSRTHRHVDGMLDAFATKGGARPRLVHRLDRDTSGVLIVAKSAAAAKELTHAFQQHLVRKTYLALVARGPERNQGRIDLPLAKLGRPGQEKMIVDPPEGGQFARTEFEVLDRAGKVAALLALHPHTGRTHQLRAHCAHIGCPILGDGKYGGEAVNFPGLPRGLMLHARRLELPGTRRPLVLEAPPPRHFRDALAHLGLAQPA